MTDSRQLSIFDVINRQEECFGGSGEYLRNMERAHREQRAMMSAMWKIKSRPHGGDRKSSAARIALEPARGILPGVRRKFERAEVQPGLPARRTRGARRRLAALNRGIT